jgi:hypothetical protein
MNMSQVVAFTQRVEFKTLLEIECRSLTGFSPVVYESFHEFNSMLALFENIDILIVDDPTDSSIFHSVQSEINSRRDQIKNVFFLSDQDLMFEDVKIYEKCRLEYLLIEMKNLINPYIPIQEGYISIPINTLIHFKVLPFALYMKINESKFLKRIPAHEEIDSTTFKSFIAKGITDLYFERKHNRDFSSMLINSMINKVEQDYVTIDEKLLATNDVFLTTQQIVGKLGFKPRVIEVCESVLNQIFEDVTSGKDNFSKFLDQLRSQKKLSFHYRLMELTSFIATQIIDESEKTGNREKVKKIIFASMFCDYTLMSPGQIHIRTHAQLTKLLFTEQKLISEHALKASELVNRYQNAPYESSMIIKQHHGSLTGVGLPKEISPAILPLTKCLMTAQEISYQILMESERHPIDLLSDIKLKFIDTPLEDFFILFENTCQKNIKSEE